MSALALPTAGWIVRLCAVLGFCGLVHAQDSLPPIDPALRARFGFFDPIIKKVSRGTGLLRAVRYRADGPVHALLSNPFRARLEDFHKAGDKLESTTISTDGDLRGLAAADLDGDGKTDLLMLTARGRLVVRRGDATKPALHEIEVGFGVLGDSLRTADVDGDGRPDAVVLTRDGLRVVTGIAGQATVGPADPTFATSVRSFDLFDLSGDGRADVVVCAAAEKMQLGIKLGRKGGFGSWILLDTERMHTAFPGTHAGGTPSLAAILHRPRRVVEYGLRMSEAPQRPAMLLKSLVKVDDERALAQGDIDHDGDLDLVIADPERARLTFLLDDAGEFAVEHAPTLAGVRSVAIGDIDGDGKNDIVLASTEEATIGVILGKGSRSAFPKPLAPMPKLGDKPGMPVVVAVEAGAVLAILRDEGRNAALYRFQDGKATELCALGRLRRDPRRLLCADLDGQHGPDIAYVLPNDGLQVVFAKGEGKFARPSGETPAGFTKNMEDGALSLTGSGAERALWAVRERYARSFRFDTAGQPVILSQDNGPDGNPSLAMGAVLGDGTRLFLDRKANKLYRLRADQPTQSIDLPPVFPRYLLAHGDDAVLLGSTGVLRVPLRKSLELHALRRHEPPTPKTVYYSGLAADLDGDGTRELLLADAHLNGLHVLVAERDKLRRALSFPVFQTNSRESSGEPHGMATGDIDGDGHDDLLLLCHDRLLIYYQER